MKQSRRVMLCGLTALLTLAFAVESWGQPVGGGLGAGTGRGGRPSKPGARPPNTRTPPNNAPNGTGVITKYSPAKNREAEGAPMGVLSMRLDDNRSVQLQVLPTQKLILGTKQFEGEELEQLLTAGLPLSVNWEVKKEKNRKVNVLVSATVPVLEIEAEVERYDSKADAVVMSAWPKAGSDWPDLKNKPTNNSGKVIKRKIKVRGIELATEIFDDANRPISIQDLEPGSKCFGTVVICRPNNIAVQLRLLAPGKTFTDPPDPGGSGPRGGGGPRRQRGGI